MKKQGKQKVKQCAYCGEMKEISREHVIPRSLFTGSDTKNVVTVPACKSCVDIKNSNDDETFLRDLVCTDIYGSQSATSQRILPDTFARSIRQSEVAHIAGTQGKLKPMYDSNSNLLGYAYSAPIDYLRVQKIFSIIVRGLYYFEMTELLPANYNFTVIRHHPHEFEVVEKDMEPHILNCPSRSRTINDDYSYTFISFKPEDLCTTCWLLKFNSGVCLSVIAVKPELDKETEGVSIDTLNRFGHKPIR